MSNSNSTVIGILGGSGAGKTFFLRCFLHHFKAHEVTLVSQDDYYIPVGEMTQEENKLYNFDLPETIDRKLFAGDVDALLSGQPVYKKEYNFNNQLAVNKILEINPAPLIIVEGLFIMHFEEIASKLDYSIFIDADEQVALARRIQRDGVERGYPEDDVRYKWLNHVLPAYKTYLLPYKNSCNYVFTNNTNNADDVITCTAEIASTIKNMLAAH